jgi:hypothetical protein
LDAGKIPTFVAYLAPVALYLLFTFGENSGFRGKHLFTSGEIPDEPYTGTKGATYYPCRTKTLPLDVVNRDGEPIHFFPWIQYQF